MKRCPYVVTYCLGKMVDLPSAVLYYHLGTFHRSGKTFLIGILLQTRGWGSEIVNQPGLQTNFHRIDTIEQ